MFKSIYPTEVTTIVYSLKNIKAKKKGRKFCVLFSIGSVKYRTDPTEDEAGNPVFDTESVLQVENPKDSLVLVATEKKEKEFYGQLIIPLNELETSRTGQIYQKQLEPHKKCPKPTGEIRFEAWISKVLTSSAVTSDIQLEKKRKLSGLKKTLVGLMGTPKLSRKFLINRGGSSRSFGKTREFSSCMDLPTGNSASLPDVSGSSLTLNNFKVPEVKVIEEENEEVGEGESKAPIISGISPNFGPFQGGTRITIRGENLGKCRQDIIGLFVCGSNVLASLEYFSSSKIACSTKPWRPGEGTISLETQSGGKCKSTIKFTFEGEITINVCDSDSDAVKRSESLKDNRGDWRVQKSGTPQMPRTILLERGPLGSKHLGISGITASKSMLDLSVPEGGNSGATMHASSSSHLLFQNANQKKGNTFKHPPVMLIQPMRLPELTLKSSKSPGKWGTGTDPSLFKGGLQEEFGGCQTVNTELRMKAHELEDENKRLKEYIGNLLSKIMNKCPEMLCNDRK